MKEDSLEKSENFQSLIYSAAADNYLVKEFCFYLHKLGEISLEESKTIDFREIEEKHDAASTIQSYWRSHLEREEGLVVKRQL